MNWLKSNWKRVAKWSGLGAGCVGIALVAFVGARWIESGSEYEGDLLSLAPTDVSLVMTVDDVGNRKAELERFLDDMIQQPDLPQLERSSLWQDSIGESLGGSLETFRAEKYEQGLKEARSNADELGLELFKDVLSDKLVICTDSGPEDDGMVILTRLARNGRFKWQFLDLASGFFPKGPTKPKLDYSHGILSVTPPAHPGEPAPRTTLIALLDDVLVISNNSRLMNGVIANHAKGGGGIGDDELYKRTVDLVDPTLRERHATGIWLNLDRMRDRLPPEENDQGELVSPVDAYNTLPTSVVSIYPDIFGPVNRIVQQDLDTRPFGAAYYGIDITEPSAVTFDQYLLVNEDRASSQQYEYLRKTWAQPAAAQTQLKLLPPDTLLQVSYRQPIDILFNEVFDQSARQSLVGDFLVAMSSPAVKEKLRDPAEELVFAAVPREYAPDSSIPLSGTDLPLPGFMIAFRTPGASTTVARALLEEYLQAQRGRSSKPGEAPKPGVVSVIEIAVEGKSVYGFSDPREEDNFIRRLNRSIRSALVGDWLILTNSQRLLEYSLRADAGQVPGLADAPGSTWRGLSQTGNATIYLNFDTFADYASSPELSKVLRDNKFNPTLIEGRDPRDIREDIVRELGLDPSDTANLSNPQVETRYKQRKIAWQQKCEIEGASYQAKLQGDMNGLRYFQDLALTTKFADDHLHARGILRTGR
ncbi:MAG: hypothetical protein KDB32_02985 [Planctomycetes bacterium]|nr:hypothetical protein [Planctomycetota bacterium]